ncbi:hypothetical protein ACKP2L_00405 (plasmid) [Oenococcus alcoholitolerans]|uniref:Resolvase HTH domain-containing protein n=1 Tax=Oenococcus alcoholitolerans TaxID=931074 RepID=A0ABR4XSS1_9LACO|nr:hypothetical protein Q757_00395 [Oenococcus alcoholitolerans]
MVDGKSVAQIAKEIGVSRQAIYRFIDKDFKRKFSTVDSSLKINSKGQKLITAHFKFNNVNENVNELSSTLQSALHNSNPLIDYLKDQIQADRRQIENYKDQIDQLHKLLEKQQTLLEHEQQLRLTDQNNQPQQIEKPTAKKRWWQFSRRS